MEKQVIYTLGYTMFQRGRNIDIEAMFNTLKSYGVEFLADVRSVPFSKVYPQCNADALKFYGEHYGVTYLHMAEIGAQARGRDDVFSKASDIFFEEEVFPISKSNRPEKEELQAGDEIVDFDKFVHDEAFVSGLGRIKKAYDRGFTLALMCSEKDPIDCHRYFLISKALEQRFGDWLEVKHIILDANADNGISTITNAILDKKLEDKIFSRTEIQNLKIEEGNLFEPEPKISKYGGTTLDEQKIDFCDRYWNLMHGWKRPVSTTYNNYNYEYSYETV